MNLFRKGGADKHLVPAVNKILFPMAEPATVKQGRAPSAVRRHAKRENKKGRLQSMAAGEALREQQMRAREEREARRAKMDGRHEFILSTVADNVSMSLEEAEDFMLDGTQLDDFSSFFDQGGRKSLIFFYQSTKDGSSAKKRLYITDGTKECYTGSCLFFIRVNTNKPITNLNIHQETFFGMLQSNGEGLLGAIEKLLDSVYIPALSQCERWGDLTEADARHVKQQFLARLNSFVAVLSNAQASIADAVKLTPCPYQPLVELRKPADIIAASTNPDMIEAAESCALTWCKEIEQILTKSEQMRKEPYDIGPKAELDHWKKRLAKFDSLTACVKDPQCRTVISLLVASKSKVLETWRELDMSITDFSNEAKDNVKFLYTLEKYCEPLYKCNPVTMLDAIPGLMNAIRMINSYSRYYNTSERMTALLVKVTNQMITACRAHITNNGYQSVWEQETEDVLRKMEESSTLNQEYQQCFQRTKQRLEEHPDERQFDFSEMYIFGKFNNFCYRLQKLQTVFNTAEVYSSLSLSHIEGIETLNSRFQLAVTTLKKKPYDVLDHRKSVFESDFEDFQRQLSDINDQLKTLLNQHMSRSSSTMQTLNTVQRFLRLQIPVLPVSSKYPQVVERFMKDLQFVQTEYNTHKQNPPLSRNLPSVANRITWSRQLYQFISKPVKLFQQLPDLLKLPVAKNAIRAYNRLAQVLVEYEVINLHMWNKTIEQIKHSLGSTVLIRDQDNGTLHVNLDPKIKEFFQEVQSLSQMNVEISSSALALFSQKSFILGMYNNVKLMVTEYCRVTDKVPELIQTLMVPHVEKIDETISPALSVLQWTSLGLDGFIESVYAALASFEQLLNKVLSMHEDRIKQTFKAMLSTPLCSIPDKGVITIEEFLTTSRTLCTAASVALETKSQIVEQAVKELVHLLSVEPTEAAEVPEDMSLPGAVSISRRRDQYVKLHQEADMLVEYYEQLNVEAMIQLLRSTMEGIRRRLATSSYNMDYAMTAGKDHWPLFAADAVLCLPNLIMKPSLDEVQQSVNAVVQMILTVPKHVYSWKQIRPTAQTSQQQPQVAPLTSTSTLRLKSKTDLQRSGPKLRTYFHAVGEHKEVIKLATALSSAVNATKTVIQSTLGQYRNYEYLWLTDRDEHVSKLAAGAPTVDDYRMEMEEYAQLEDKIAQEPDSFNAGTILLRTEQLKATLIVEAKQWRVTYGRAMSHHYQTTMDEIFKCIEEWNKFLSRPLKDLDDVRGTMATLKEIRENEIRIDMCLGPVEECYTLLQKHGISVNHEDIERVDTLRYLWQNLQSLVSEKLTYLLKVQPTFESSLLENVVQFKKDVDQFVSGYNEKGPMVTGISPREASDRLVIFQTHFDELWRKLQTYSGGEELFGMSVTPYPDFTNIRKELNLLQKLYNLYNTVMDSVDGYYDVLWAEVDIDKINSELLDFQTKCRKLPKALKEYSAFRDLTKKIEDFNTVCPLLERMADKAMKERHWKRIEELTGHTFDIDSEGFTLRSVMEAPLLQNMDDIEDICIAAVKERDIEAKMKQVAADWAVQNLSFSSFKTRGELLLRGEETSEIIALMEDSLMVLSSLMSNRYNAPFKPDIQKWVRNLTNTSEILENWLVVQNLWVYLEAVFVGGDIAKQLPKEAKRFQNIDKSWVKILTKAHETPNVVKCCVGDETLGQLLPHLLEQLELCQKSLTGYLEKKRLVFPRFFFVSDPALLEILGQASDSHTIQAHLLSLFDNVKTVTFHEKEYDRITHINSKEPETIELEKPVMAQGPVELWIGKLLTMVKQSVHAVIKASVISIKDPNFDLLEFLNTFPAQVGLLGLQIIWTADATHALKYARADRKIMSQTDQHFLDILNSLIEMTTKELKKIDRVKYETLITIHLHQRDIFNDLVRMSIKSATDFEWLKQSRFYFSDETDTTVISVTDVNFVYQNEFTGCTERLVITPLTDRCYITLAQALGMSMGGSPAGPAGTGKTETVKDMGKTLGKYVVVFNCSDQMDFRGLGRIYKGLAQSGTWGCFDEFNRIELPVLSVAAQQIAVVLQCRKDRKSEFIFTDGDVVTMNSEFGLFLTMNPGYAGRQELPENLKMNFRPIAMMVPDRQIIIRVKLASCGFLQNTVLACKFYTLYKLCEEQLSKQVHYDFGLRNILSVLRSLGPVKRICPNDSEEMIVMRVLRDMNLSKLVDEDEPLFLSLLNDLFPGIQLDQAGYPDLENAIANNVKAAHLINHPPWTLKLIQLYETQRVRHGFMALGPSGAGKTNCIHVLMKAMADTGEPHREMRMNPKAITAPQMFGRLDVATNDWTDGIFSTLWRRSHKAKKGEHIWLVMDGPVDTLWIENLNSVLDDNKTLTLANGDRIPMYPDCKLVFEPDNVDNASPATVSRNGMVYMSSSALDWNPIFHGWLSKKVAEKKITRQESDILTTLFEGSFIDLYNWTSVSTGAKIKLLECNYISQACIIMEGVLPQKEDNTSLEKSHLEHLYIFSLMWSVGATLELQDRSKMEEWLRQKKPELDYPVLLNEGDTIFEFVPDNKGAWQHWTARVEEYVYPKDSVPAYSSILVPNVDNVRTDYLINTVAKQSKPVLLIGEQGTAKTVIIKGYVSKYDSEEHLSKGLSFSSVTTPNHYQRSIESYIDKRVGSTYGPPAGKKLTVFIDDVNMPIINEWGDQVTNEIVRQLIEMQGIYSLEKPGDFTHIEDVQFLAAMIHPGGGRNDIPARLKRQFCVFNCTLPSNASIDKIFGVIGTGYFCRERGFSAEVINTIPKLVVCTRRLWQLTKVKMLPTPAKFHYIFNLRDLSRIWEGMLNANSDTLESLNVLMALWKHEATRVIADRFTNFEDKEWFDRCLIRAAEEDLGEELTAKVPDEPYFVDFLREAPEPTGDEPEDFEFEAPKIYEQIPSYPELEERLNSFLLQYNETVRGAGMDLVFFKDAMVHLVKVSRIIRTDRGNALLVGVGGSGKQSLTRLSSFIAGYKTFQIQLSRTYGINNLLDDLKVLYKTAGVQGKGMTFLFTDQEIKDEGFLEYINNVLSSGEISNLFSREEIDEINSELIPVMKREFPRRPPTPENLYDYFLSRARMNLHVVLCFSPVGEKFRSRSLKFPGLFSGCTMDWFSRWPKDALVAVAQHFVGNFDIVCTDKTKQEVIQAMGVFHDFVAESCVSYFERFRRTTHVTPKSYLSFIGSYKRVYTEKKAEIQELANRMNTGLEKLLDAGESVSQLAKELAVKEKELAVASKEAEKVLADVTVKAQAAEKVKAEVQKVKDRAQAVADGISADKAVAEGKLEVARPALEEAEAALKTINSGDIATVRKLGKPPHLIMRIMDCVLLLFQRHLNNFAPDPERPSPKPSWAESLKMMSQTGFLQSLQNFRKDTINEETVELMQPYFANEDYSLDSAKKVCGNVAGLCSWTKSMAVFYGINKEVLPLKANLAIQEVLYAKAESELAAANATLDEKQSELDVVRALYDEAMGKKQTLLDDAETCRRKMKAASALIEGLGGEKERWTQQSKEFEAQVQRLVGDLLLCSGFLSYSGPFNQEFRQLIQNSWKKELSSRKVPFTPTLNVTDMLTDTITVGEWNLQGLPNDELSVQNGIIVTKATRYPLIIDPQGQGKTWIKNRESVNKDFSVTNLNNKYFRTHLEDSLSLGKPLLIEDVEEELDPALDNILEKNFIKSGTMLKVKVGDKEVDVMKGFMLYITTKLPNPSYTPEVSARTAIIDFTVTVKGLEDQLLGRVILTEKQELESERVQLMTEVTANKGKMKELEDNLLFRLTSTKGSLVDDESLIEVLRTTKSTAEDVTQKLEVAAQTEIKINNAREEYRPVATRGSVLYFLIVEMSMVNVMYQTSLVQFLEIFDLSMARSAKSPVTMKRIKNIVEYLTFEAFRYCTRGLYEEHKFLFTLLLALKIDMQKGHVKHNEFQTLIKGGAALDLKACPPKAAKWITDMTWLNLVELSNLPQFSDILQQIGRNDKAWKAWFDTEAPEDSPPPDGYGISLDTLRKLLLIRSFCPDRVLPQARKYIAESMGAKYAEGVILDMEKMWEESTIRVPMICFQSMGSDPSNNIETLAKKHKITCGAVSMGQGQEVHARRLLQQCQTQGGWTLLQNVHLGMGFLDELLLSVLETETVHESFRLWLTTEVHPKFPINLLQSSIKYTFEPPQGVKAGLKRTYTNLSQEQLDISNLSQWKPMLYAVAFLHTTVQERRKFGPLGWNIPYEFNQGDYNASVQYVQNLLDELDLKKGISWGAVRYMLGEIQYGGRVTDDYDKHLLITYAKHYFGDHMFQSNFKFYKGFPIPVFKTVKEYLEYIETLPLVITPEVFGLHLNADITYQSNTAKQCLDTILEIQPKDSSSGGGETRESIVRRMAGEMLEKLPNDYIPHEVRARLQKMGAIAPMNIFLRQEIDRMQRVIKVVRSTLKDLQLAIDGTIIMSETLKNILDNMYDARVPTPWRKVSWESTTIGFWFTELLERDAQFRAWVFEARPNVFWMTGFFNPQGFLTAMRQEVTRAHKGWSLDSVVVHNEVTKMSKEDVTAPPAEGVYVHSLFLDGAGWDRRNSRLIEPTPKVLYISMPVIHIYAVNNTSGKDPKLYVCPVYKKPRRTDLTYITALVLRSNQHPDHWTFRGTALLCDIK